MMREWSIGIEAQAPSADPATESPPVDVAADMGARKVTLLLPPGTMAALPACLQGGVAIKLVPVFFLQVGEGRGGFSVTRRLLRIGGNVERR